MIRVFQNLKTQFKTQFKTHKASTYGYGLIGIAPKGDNLFQSMAPPTCGRAPRDFHT